MESIHDGYRLRRVGPEAAGDFYDLIHEVYAQLPDKQLFSVGSIGPEWYEETLRDPGFGVIAESPEGELCGLLIVRIPGLNDKNLGRDIALPDDQLLRVAEMDTAAVLPAHRGHRLERRMLLFAEEELRASPYRLLMCTVSPYNLPSLKSVQTLGYEVMTTKEKYGGYLRHVLLKRLPEA